MENHMLARSQQEGYLASISQSFDVGDFDYLPPADLQSLDILIAEAWQALRQQENVDARILDIQQALGRA
ncbi:MAG: hypothetical protein HC772_05305 [Leptolyngbyaceae cyanobacterium CRU_2_3]|nr:hypothetical protein [Leptolyngbyaceae cyanobacterium CRU_2_3]